MAPVTPLRVLLASPGLGHQARGAETFTAECFAALRDDPRLDLILAAGAGPRRRDELRIPTLPRDSAWGIRLGSRLGGDGYTGEVSSFTIGLLPHLVRLRPRVVYVSDLLLLRLLRRWRRATRSRFRLLLWNGAPYPPPFPEVDLVQQLTEERVRLARDAGERSERQDFVPPGLSLARRRVVLDAEAKRALRRRLGIETERPVVVSVGVLDPHTKGQDRLARACARSEREPTVVLLGARADATAALEEAARSALGEDRLVVRTVERAEVDDYYDAADVFALASLREGFGIVFVEAAAHGLPCVVDPDSGARDVLGVWGTYVDTRDEAAFAAAIDAALEAGEADAVARHEAMVARYDWTSLTESYVAMFQRAAALSMR